MRLPRPGPTARAGLLLGALTAVLAASLAGVRVGETVATAGHLVGYAALAAAFAVALDRPDRPARTVLAGAFAGAVLVGVGVEAVQPAVGRTASAADAVANAVGATAGLTAYRIGHRWLRFDDGPAGF